MHLNISDANDHFMMGKKEFFYLADTVWSAFTNITIDEWREYLRYRKLQGFNVLQISVLPLTDKNYPNIKFLPFAVKEDGSYNYHQINEAYFLWTTQLLDEAQAYGFTPMLVLLWCIYIPGTWASIPDNTMPIDALKPYIEYVTNLYAKYNPIYSVSGDTKFETEEICKYYTLMLALIKKHSPSSLTTMHLNPMDHMPDQFVNAETLDFYMYQSGHEIQYQDRAYSYANSFYSQPVKRPVINGEPCYEGHGYGFRYGRFAEFDVRKAIWQSLLSGAKAGIAYGAHGVWSWHREGVRFGGVSFSDTPYTWREALTLKGAWDAGFAKWIYEMYGLFDIEPANRILNQNAPDIRMAISKDERKIVIYCPYNTNILIDMNLSGYELTLINLAEKMVAYPVATFDGDKSMVKMHCFNNDVLIIGIAS